MTGPEIAAALACALALILPVVALRRQEFAWGRAARMAVIWLCLFALAAMGFAWLGVGR